MVPCSSRAHLAIHSLAPPTSSHVRICDSMHLQVSCVLADQRNEKAFQVYRESVTAASVIGSYSVGRATSMPLFSPCVPSVLETGQALHCVQEEALPGGL